MTKAMSAESGREMMSRAWRGRPATKALLVAGIVAAAVYAVGDVFSGLLYEGYSFKDQAISELSAYGSPVRPLMLTVLTAHGLLGAAFSVGLWRSGDRTRALRWTGAFLLAAGAVGLILHPFFPMSSRGMEFGFNDTMHQILTGVWGLPVSPAVVFAAVAYRGWFRLYSIVSLVVMMVFGWLAMTAMEGVGENVPTPWAGGFERINAYVLMAWLVVLAVTVMRRLSRDVTPETADTDRTAGTDMEAQTKEPAMAARG